MDDSTCAMDNLQRNIITPANEQEWLSLRSKNINSTEVAPLFGLSPFKTYAELWLEKRDNTQTEFKMNKRIKAGQVLEPAIAQLIADDNGWTVKPFKNYIEVPELKIGSSFDYAIYEDGQPVSLFEIKNVDAKFWKDWHNDDGELEAKNHIELQCQWQMLVSGIHKLKLGVLFGGNDWHVLSRDYNPVIGEMMLERVAEFWRKVEANEQPQFDYSNPKDQKLIQLLFREANPPKVLRADDNKELKEMYTSYRTSKKEEAAQKAMNEALRARLIETIGDASEIYGDDWAFTAKEQSYGDWTDIEAGKASTLPDFDRGIILYHSKLGYALSKMDSQGMVFVGEDLTPITDFTAWAYRADYKPKTISRVIRDKKVKLK